MHIRWRNRCFDKWRSRFLSPAKEDAAHRQIQDRDGALRYPASFVAFDCIYIEGKELIWTPLMDRKEQLSRLVNEDSRIAVSRYVEGSGTALYMAAEASKLEGVVAKEKTAFI